MNIQTSIHPLAAATKHTAASRQRDPRLTLRSPALGYGRSGYGQFRTYAAAAQRASLYV